MTPRTFIEDAMSEANDGATLSWVVNVNGAAPKIAKANSIRTTKYTYLNFIPRNLWHQFHRVSNIYFLVCACLNFSPDIAAFGANVAFIPLIFVLAVTASKDFYEDSRRRKSDKEINGKVTTVAKPGGNDAKIGWSQIRVGQVIRLKAGDQIPADLLLLHSSDEKGLAFVDTAELDGETNLKAKSTFVEPKPGNSFDPSRFSAPIRCEPPNVKIYEFVAVVDMEDKKTVLGPDNLLLRGCVLRNTAEVYGLVLYTGPQSKVMLNNTGPKLKRSSLETQMNSGIVMCIMLMLLMASAASLGTYIMDNKYDDLDGIDFHDNGDYSISGNAAIRFFTWWVILQALVPLALYVTIEVVKLIQVFFIHLDIELYDPVSDTPVQCRAFNITEDLGQIEYIFSDKTGTLTQNLMVFRCCAIGAFDYAHGFAGLAEGTDDDADDSGPTEEGAAIELDSTLATRLGISAGARGASPNVDVTSDIDADAHLFMLSMAICNTVRPAIKAELRSVATESGRRWAKGEIKYESESPDESAFVAAAEDYGYTLVAYAAGEKHINVAGQVSAYKLLATLPFDSTRKRMSVVVQGPDGKILLLCKGADSAIFERLADQGNEAATVTTCQNIVHGYALKGLRTLAWSSRELEQAMFQDWHQRWEAARASLGLDKAARIMVLMLELESKLHLLGATGVEDALQVGVPRTIAALREAGINVWVLTGDKQETAIQIAHTCRLFTQETQILLLNSDMTQTHVDELSAADAEAYRARCVKDVRETIEKLERQYDETPATTKCGLVVDGATLAYCLSDPENHAAMVKLAMKCATVVGCRTTPMQKAQVVMAIREKLPVLTLAIGDGANDCSMIQTAHVGIGISGREGMQAVMASDFAISQFRFLGRLLFVHGHWSYDRMCFLVMYFFWKNTMANVTLFLYGPFSWYSGTLSFEPLGLLLYYMFFTSLPPAITAIFDKVLSAETLLAIPQLYEHGRLNRGYSKRQVLINVGDGVLTAILIFFMAYGMTVGTDASLYQFGAVQMASTVFIGNIWVLMETKNNTYVDLFGHVLMIATYVAFCAVWYNADVAGTVPDPYGLFGRTFGVGWWWGGWIAITVAATLGRMYCIMVRNYIWPTIKTLAHEDEVKTKGPLKAHDSAVNSHVGGRAPGFTPKKPNQASLDSRKSSAESLRSMTQSAQRITAVTNL
jgi:phospholipid-translocating P-type ATPase (flippase)